MAGRPVAPGDETAVEAPLEDAIRAYSAVEVDGPMVRTARSLGISLGDGVTMP